MSIRPWVISAAVGMVIVAGCRKPPEAPKVGSETEAREPAGRPPRNAPQMPPGGVPGMPIPGMGTPGGGAPAGNPLD